MATHKLLLLPGDGIGPEVAREVEKVVAWFRKNGVGFETETDLLYYNAGIDPDARDLSPGVLMVYAYVRRALERGLRRMDFLRGDEPYKYEWGAVDEPIQRVLLRRAA